MAFQGKARATIPNFLRMASTFIRSQSRAGGGSSAPGGNADGDGGSGAESGDILNGEVDWVYEEELDTKSNYFWSPDSKNLAFLQMIEAEVPEYPIHRLDPDSRHGR